MKIGNTEPGVRELTGTEGDVYWTARDAETVCTAAVVGSEPGDYMMTGVVENSGGALGAPPFFQK